MHKSIIKATLAALVLGGLTTAARADLTWDWSFTTTAPTGPSVSGSGTLTTGPVGSGLAVSGYAGTYVITSITGTFGGSQITGLSPLSGWGSPDDIIYGPGILPGIQPLDGNGLSFTDSSGDTENIAGSENYSFAADSNYTYIDIGPFTATLQAAPPAAAPEPAQMLSGLMVAGLGGASLLMRRFRNRK